MDLATLLDGPAIMKHRNQRVGFSGGLTVTPLSELFTLSTDQYGELAKRALENSIVISGTPEGVFNAGLCDMLYRWQNPVVGQLLTPRYDVSAVDDTADTLTLVGAVTPRTGCPFRISAFPGGTLPTPLSAATLYFWGATGKVHTTEAGALANTGAVNLTDVGDGDFAIIEQEYIQIDALNANRRITFHNGAVSVMPPAIFSAIRAIYGPASFVAFRKNNAAWSDANSVYTVEKMALADTAPDEADIPTQQYGFEWGAAPLDSFLSRGEATITPNLATEAISSDGLGNVGLRISGLTVGATLQPQDLSPQQMLDLLQLQGGTNGRGKSRIRGDLNITGTGVFASVYNAAPKQLPLTFQANGPLAGQLEIEGAYKPGSGWFRIATTAP